MNLSSDQGWSSGESTRLPPMWPGFNATVFVSSLNALPQSLQASSPCMGSEASRESLFACCSRVTSCDLPKWRACSQAIFNRDAISGYVYPPNVPIHGRSHEWCPLSHAPYNRTNVCKILRLCGTISLLLVYVLPLNLLCNSRCSFQQYKWRFANWSLSKRKRVHCWSSYLLIY